jgi:hypothetical protein
VGVSYVSAGLGDVWRLANPLETIFAAAERAFARLGGRSLSRGIVPPRWMGMWPVVFLYLAFLWMEIAWEGSDSPASIAALMLGYAALTWTGMWLYGRETWLERGEVFNRVFGVFARFAPLRLELAERRVAGWELRPYAVGLFEREPQGPSEFALVILILAAVSFDGFLETPAWAAISQALSDDEAARWPRTLGLLAAPILFASVFLLCSRMAAVMCLVPIAIAYLVAHYLSFLATAGQYLVPLVSDPLGLGWNLFGTAQHFVRMGIVDARWVWMVALGAIVAGHVAALYLGHLFAMRESSGRRAAVRGQLPMLALMVGYTMASLWIIAQPIVSNR